MPELQAAAFAFEIRGWITLLISLGAALLSLIALISCAVQKPEAFNAVGTLSKGAWTGILLVCFVLALLLGVYAQQMLFMLIAIAASLVYLLEVRTGIKDIGGSVY